jgi:hypothetical protein
MSAPAVFARSKIASTSSTDTQTICVRAPTLAGLRYSSPGSPR